jgi:hypothetical protein
MKNRPALRAEHGRDDVAVAHHRRAVRREVPPDGIVAVRIGQAGSGVTVKKDGPP